MPTDNGGADVTDYEVLMDDGKGGAFASKGLTSNQLEYKANGLSMGLAYRFKVRAKNEINFSETANSEEIIAAVVPTAPDAPTITA